VRARIAIRLVKEQGIGLDEVGRKVGVSTLRNLLHEKKNYRKKSL
jgi:hypothetical protein